MNNYLIFGLGFLSQVLFFARTIAQWFKSEKEGEVISPDLFWILSLVASLLMLAYGIFRNDLAILLGQYIVYFIYIRNLQLKNSWKKIPAGLRFLFFIAPIAIFFWLLFGATYNFSQIIGNKDIPFLLMFWGLAGQIIFTFRFIYQWIYSEKKNDSVLPLGFWIISTVGSVMIFVYSIFRLDPVLFMAHSLGIFIYGRNILLCLGKKSIFSKIEIPFINKTITKVSDKIK